MATRRDYYEILGISRDASAQQIKRAYRQAAVRWHPDRNPDDEEAEARFKEAAEAYSVLSDSDKRARYDRFGHQGVSGAGFSGFDPSTFGDFADILGDFFGFGDIFGGARRRRTRAQAGADLRYELSLTLEEAAFGTKQTLQIPRLETCATCSGSGAAPGSQPVTCSACGGRGQVRFTQGFFTVARTCPQCRGEGRVNKDPCPDCEGAGRIEMLHKVEVDIPAGVDSGNRLRLAGEGEHGSHGGPTGDLYVDIVVEPHPAFERRGADVVSTLSLHYAQAVLGATLEVETLHGSESLRVPAGTSHGQELRLHGKGIPRLGRSGRGDHVVRVEIDVPRPKDLSEEQQELLHRLAELDGKEVDAERGVFDRVRDLFG
jgi:molecular chaperone DnaJ